MHREVFAGRDAALLTVGEMPGVTVEQAQLFTDPARAEVDMVFQFEHVDLDQGSSKWDVRPLRLRDLKASFGRWQAGLADVGWNSLYWDNHDQPRAVSRFGDDRPEFRRDSATCLATLLHLHRGTPYVYQGEEIGMANYPVRLGRRLPGRRVGQPLRRRRWSPARTRPTVLAAHAPDEPGQRADAGAVGRLAVRRVHHRDAVAAGEPRPRRVERRRPAGRPDLRARALPAADRAAARGPGGGARRLRDAAARARHGVRVHPHARTARCCSSSATSARTPLPAGRPAAPGASDAELVLGNLPIADPAVLRPWEARVLRPRERAPVSRPGVLEPRAVLDPS